MNKIYLSGLALTVFFLTQLHAQESKMNIPLFRYITNPSNIATRSVEIIPLLVKGDVNKIRGYVTSHGGVFKYVVANKYASITLPFSAVNDFAQSAFVKRVEGVYNSHGRPMSDSIGCHQSFVFPVHNDSTPLSRAYLGDSVVLGVIDDGFDFSHKDFRQTYDTTKTRFISIWDQTVKGTPPSGFNYGTEWDSAAINNGSCTEADPDGHGTNVLGDAAGNGQSFSPSLAYIGVAPHANIIAVKYLPASSSWLNNIVDGAQYIFSKADSLHEPCVINLSIGDYGGSHDGQELVTQMLDSLITEHAGRTFVAATGNGREYYPDHLGYAATSDSLFTWFSPSPIYHEAFEFWIDTNQADNFNFTVGVDNPAKWIFIGRDSYLNIKDFNLKSGINAYAGTVKNSNGVIVFRDTLVVEQVNDTYHFVYYIGTDSTKYFYRFITQGSGRFDLWSEASNNLTPSWNMGSHAFQAALPTVGIFPDFARYVYPDSLQSICGYFQCSGQVISVANYTNRDSWTQCNGTVYTSTGETPGQLSAGSSFGPTRDGRIEPDISAPGDETLAPGDAGWIAGLGTSSFKVTKGCVYDRNGGTSLSAPFVAGVAALYLQRYPKATWKDVKKAIDSCAYKDGYTGATPISYEWGYGKVDAFCAMQHQPDTSTTTGAPIQPVAHNVLLKNYPNPFSNYTNIVYSFGALSFQSAEIEVYNVLGQKIATLPIHSSSGSLQFNNNNLSGGMYIYKLVIDQKTIAANKFIILN